MVDKYLMSKSVNHCMSQKEALLHANALYKEKHFSQLSQFFLNLNN